MGGWRVGSVLALAEASLTRVSGSITTRLGLSLYTLGVHLLLFGLAPVVPETFRRFASFRLRLTVLVGVAVLCEDSAVASKSALLLAVGV